MLRFINREQELLLLEQEQSHRSARLIAVQGRRRIGKSSLIQRFATSAEIFLEFQGLAPYESNGKKVSQLENFAELFAEQSSLPLMQFRNWTEAFSTLANYVEGKKTVILLDEISWMASDGPELPSKLKIAWDTHFKNNPSLMLFLCGSVSGWIQENILENRGFVGRVSRNITVGELSPKHSKELLQIPSHGVSDYDILKVLAITGGVPRYLEEFNLNTSVENNVRNLCFQPGGFLLKEFNLIFKDIFQKRGELYKEIVRQLVNQRQSLTELAAKLGRTPTGTLSAYLTELELAGFLAKDTPYTFQGKRVKSSLYRIKDNYLRFFLKYIEPKLEQINQGLDVFPGFHGLSAWHQIMGFQFENLILNNIPLVLSKLNIEGRDILSASPYFQRKTTRKHACQIDLLIQTRFNSLYVCEIKFGTKVGLEVEHEIREKIARLVIPKRYSIRPILIYAGERTDGLQFSDYFAGQIGFSEFL